MEAFTNFLLFLLSVIFISLSGVMMPGPVFLVTLAKGFENKFAGSSIALGHSVVELPLIFLIYFGFEQIFSSSIAQKIIGFAGGLILIFMSAQTFRARNKVTYQHESSKRSSFIAGIIATSANPYFFLWWATIGVALIANANAFGISGLLLLSATHLSCDFLWNTFVSFTTFKSKRYWNAKMHKLTISFCFIVLAGFGIWFIVSALT